MERVVVKPYDKKRYIVAQSYFYIDDYSKAEIPAGFKSNGADIPRFLWSLFPPYSPEYLTGAIIHDYLCANAKSLDDKLNADKSFYVILLDLGVNARKAWLFYAWCKIYHKLKWWIFKK